MTLTSAVILAIFALANRHLGKSFLYPPAFYSAWWSFLLFALVICGDAFYPLSLKTLLMFVVGAGAFSLGGLAHTLFSSPAKVSSNVVSNRQKKFALAISHLGLIALLVAFPSYLQRLQELSAASNFTDFWRGVRQQTSTASVGDYGLGGYEYLMVFASFLSLIALFHNDGSRKGLARMVTIITVTLVYTFLTASRLAAMTTIFAIIALSWLRSSKPHWRLLLVCAILFAIVFAAPAVLLEKGGGLGLTFAENASGVVESLQVYTVGGLVAFDQVIDDVSLFPERLSFRFFSAVANAAGLHIDVPVLILPFTGTPTPTNVYTIYGSYFADFGWGGTLLLLFVLGASLAWLYGHAKRGQPEAVILYAVAVSRLMMTAATDGFLLSLSFWLQMTLFTLLVYRWPRLTERNSAPSREKATVTMPASMMALSVEGIVASLDIIIVNWNTSDALRECLTSIAAADTTGLLIQRVIVVDNASTDASSDFMGWPSLPLRFIRNTRNRGFAAACNQGAQISKADYILFLNPDTRLAPDALTCPIEHMERAESAKIGICGIRLTGMLGEPGLCCATFPTVLSLMVEGLDRLLPRIFPRRLLRSNDLRDSRTVDQIVGAFFLVRRAVFDALDGFDERFFLYFEEVDFSLRAKALGFDSFYLADVASVHLGGLSSGKVKSKRLFYSLRSRIQFAAKHFSRQGLVGLVLFTALVEPLARIVWSCRRLSAGGLSATVKGYAELYNYLFQTYVLPTSPHGNSGGEPTGNHR